MKPTRTANRVGRPNVENYPPLDEWLKKVNGTCNWQKRVGTSMIESWTVGGQIVLIEVHANGSGWNLYTSCRSNLIETTLLDAEARTGWSSDVKVTP